ncbi:SOS response-associated peptidase [Roseimarinus sediminis]|jgi:putative SOS response-associated peptidase YedK|uniref:SOS response-associated peptidase n=1 Tax=Roseimarinus sediminis TaxID=1610899 RepID=UPI003D190505
MAAEQRFNAAINDLLKFKPSEHINGFAFPETAVISDQQANVIDHFQWGLIPHWARDESVRKFTLNARIETLKEKPSFRDAVNQRCMILADGFYEWKWLDNKGKRKQRYLITVPGDELFAFAGIWSEWTNPQNGQKVKGYSIVTTEAQGIMREIHNSKLRMPVILSRENERQWLQNAPIDDFRISTVSLNATAV